MPSHITHYLFGIEAARIAGIPISNLPLFTLGCQGPDIFLHGQISYPSALHWGQALHRSGYRRCTHTMANTIIEKGLWNSPLTEYLLGWLSHAILDRAAHPFIIYHSGWGEQHYLHHPFLERLIDMEMLELKTRRTVNNFSFFQKAYLGESLPESLADILAETIESHFEKTDTRKNQQKIANAYRDTMAVLKLTDAWSRETITAVLEQERILKRKRLLGLLHPPMLAGKLDVLNLEHREWTHPWFERKKSTTAFTELFDNAISTCVRIFSTYSRTHPHLLLAEILQQPDFSLDSAAPDTNDDEPIFSNPLPLEKALEDLYASVLPGKKEKNVNVTAD